MQKVNIKELADKFSAGNCTEEELAILENWYLQWKPEAYDVDKARLEAHMKSVWQELPVHKKPEIFRLWKTIITSAAAAVALVTLGVWLYQPVLNWFRNPGGAQYANNIAPGKNTATLALANGKIIDLDTNKTSVVVTDSVNTNTMLVASTPRGGTYMFTLPDGTKVWLNADSKIEFPSNFSNDKQRIVKLEGEAYFAVAHNEKQPFRVESRGQVVEDIGTEFNISAYADERSMKTTLVEGEAAVNGTILKPNQQATVGQDKRITVTEVDAANEVLWQAGKFSFKSEALNSIMRKIARWYDVEVVFQAEELKAIEVSGSVSRFANLSILLNKLEQTGGIRFRIEGKKVYISK